MAERLELEAAELVRLDEVALLELGGSVELLEVEAADVLSLAVVDALELEATELLL